MLFASVTMISLSIFCTNCEFLDLALIPIKHLMFYIILALGIVFYYEIIIESSVTNNSSPFPERANNQL